MGVAIKSSGNSKRTGILTNIAQIVTGLDQDNGILIVNLNDIRPCSFGLFHRGFCTHSWTSGEKKRGDRYKFFLGISALK